MLCVSVLLYFPLLLYYLRNTLHISQQETKSKYTKIIKVLRKVTRVNAVIIRALTKMAKMTKAGDRGSTVVQMLCYKSEGRWFDPSWCHWNFSLT